MAEHDTQPGYEAACVARIKAVFAERGIGAATRVSLLRKYTDAGYLFFVGFAHFDAGLAGTPAASLFRADLEQDQEARVPLPGDHYWLAHPYQQRRDAPGISTLEHQSRLMGSLPKPTLVRQSAGVALQPPVPARQQTQDPLPRPFLVRDGGRPNNKLPPAAFADWLIEQPPAVQTGYRSALSSGQQNLVKQYHREAEARGSKLTARPDVSSLAVPLGGCMGQ